MVIGAILAYVMASQVAGGLIMAFKDDGEKEFQFENGLVISFSILLGTVVAFFPAQVTNSLPTILRPILGNGFVTGIVSAIVLEHMIFRKW